MYTFILLVLFVMHKIHSLLARIFFIRYGIGVIDSILWKFFLVDFSELVRTLNGIGVDYRASPCAF